MNITPDTSADPQLSREDALAILNTPDESLEELISFAETFRRKYKGNHVSIHILTNARSGNCAMDCRVCSQSRHNHTPIAVFDLLPDETLRERILELAALPVNHIGIVTSGAALSEAELARLRAVLAALPDNVRPRVCASLGRLNSAQLEQLAQAGLTRYHHNLETAQGHYPRVCTTQTWEQRRDTVAHAMRAGLTACTGGLFGLGESWEERIAFAFSLKALGVRNVPMNFLHPHPETPLAGQQPLSADEALRIIALFRHILPEATLRICGGRPTTLGARQHEIFAAGANALMTGDYLTTHGQGIEEDLAMIAAQGLEAGGDA